MSLVSSKDKLLRDIESAYNTAKEDGSESDNFKNTVESLAQNISNAIHAYMTSAEVFTNVIVSAGQLDTAGGSTTSTGTGSGTGKLS